MYRYSCFTNGEMETRKKKKKHASDHYSAKQKGRLQTLFLLTPKFMFLNTFLSCNEVFFPSNHNEISS